VNVEDKNDNVSVIDYSESIMLTKFSKEINVNITSFLELC